MKKEVRIALLMIVGLGILYWGYHYLKGQDLLQKVTKITARFDTAEGLKTGDGVTYKGIKVGSVADIDIKVNDPRPIIAHLDIDSDYKFPKNTKIVLSSTTVLGDKQLKLIATDACDGSDCLQTGDELQATSQGILNTLIPENEMDNYVGKLKSGFGEVMDTVNTYFRGEGASSETAKVMRDMKLTMANLAATTGQLASLLRQSNADMKATFQNLNAFSSKIADSNGHLASSIKNLETFSAKLNQLEIDKSVKNVNDVLDNTDKTLVGLQASIKDLNGILGDINSEKGTLGKLVNNDELYTSLTSTTNQLNFLLQDLRLNPKRYINVSVFGKKQKDYALPKNDPLLDSLYRARHPHVRTDQYLDKN